MNQQRMPYSVSQPRDSGQQLLSSGGAAMTEFVVLCLAMVPLMYAIPMVGKMVDAKQTSIQAGRYATWEATVHRSGGADRELMRDRFFGESDALISSSSTEAGSHWLWGGQLQYEQGLPSDTAIQIDETSISMQTQLHKSDSYMDVSSEVGSVIDTVGDALGSVTSRDWGIGKTALTRTEVKLSVRSNGWLDSLGRPSTCGSGFGCLVNNGAILVDGWSARDDRQAKERVQAIVPATALEPIGEVLSVIGKVPIFNELENLDTAFGYVDMEQLPDHADRGLDRYEER